MADIEYLQVGELRLQIAYWLLWLIVNIYEVQNKSCQNLNY